MGLDWIIDSKPIEGNEILYNKILEKLNDPNILIIEHLELRRELKLLSIKSLDYFLNELIESGYVSDSITNIKNNIDIQLEYMAQYIKPDNISEDEFENWSRVYDPTNFRGKVVSRSDILSYEICREASRDHTPSESLLYAEKIDKELEVFEKSNIGLRQLLNYNRIFDSVEKTTDSESENFKPDNLEEILADLMYGKIASKWLKYWGSRGFGYIASY